MLNGEANGTTKDVPRFMTIREIAKTGILPECYLRNAIKDGTLPTRVIKTGNKYLINFDLLLENLSKVGQEEEA